MSAEEEAAIEDSRDAGERPAKRSRISLACTWCRERKSRCDGAKPKCSTCSKLNIECKYSHIVSLTKSAASKEYLDSIFSRIANLETSVTGLQTRLHHLEGGKGSITSTSSHHDTGSQSSHEDEETTVAERQDPTDGIGSIAFSREAESGFFGPSSNIALTRQIIRATTAIMKSTNSSTSPMTPANLSVQSHMLHVSRPASPDTFALDHPTPNSTRGEPFVLPPYNEAVQSIDHYFNTTGVLFPYIDRYSFLKKFKRVVSSDLKTAPKAWLGLLNMVLAMATSVMTGERFSANERSSRSEVFFQRALKICNREIRRGTSLEVVQVLLLMSQYLQSTERSIETWNLHGLAVKAAYQLGLHSPNSLKQFEPAEREIRTRTWYACILLDRTLSMTMGRPCSIPESFVRLDLPRSTSLLPVSPPALGEMEGRHDDTQSTGFFTATINLYKIMGEVIDLLYGSNLGVDSTTDIYETASHLLRFEQKFLSWKGTLSFETPLIETGRLESTMPYSDTLRFRVILTLRFLNIRILTHRPLLCRYLEALSDPKHSDQPLLVLRPMCLNSTLACLESATAIITLIRSALELSSSSRHVLGAWWFSLYYAFNAALVIYAVLLVQHQARTLHEPLAVDDWGVSMQTLQDAVMCLSALSGGNRMADKCVRYTSTLAQLLASICQPQTDADAQINDVAAKVHFDLPTNKPDDIDAAQLFELFTSTDLQMGMDINELFNNAAFNDLPQFGDIGFGNGGMV